MTTEVSIPVPELELEVDALIDAPERPAAAYVFAHGAGAGMQHAFMQKVAERLASRGLAVLRYQFPYIQRRIEEGKRWGRPDPAAKLEATVAAAVVWAADRFVRLRLFAGGKSLGGRMTSRWTATAERLPEQLRGLVLFGFPLHPPGKPGDERAAHLADVTVPMLFLAGDRDSLADLDLLKSLVQGLEPAGTLQVVEGADHGFHVLKRSGRSDDEVVDQIATLAADWMLRQRGI